MSKVLLIIRGDNKPQLSSQILKSFRHLGFLNVAVVHNAFNRLYVDYAKDISMGLYATSDLSKPKWFFLDKLKNLKGYPIKIACISEQPRIKIQSHQMSGPMVYFVKILREKMNGNIIFPRIWTVDDIANLWMSKNMHLTLNTAIRMPRTDHAPKLLTYEENGYCALVPKPPRTSVTELIFIKPFDRFVWLLLGLTVLACLVTWRLFYNRGTSDSFWLLMFGMFAMFVGQGVQFRRTNRVVLIILLQLIVSVIFVLSNGYQGAITSFMIQPESENRMKTVKELLDSDIRITSSPSFENLIQDSEEFQKIQSKLDVTHTVITSQAINNLTKHKSTLIMKCDMAEYILTLYETLSSYYMLPEKILLYIEQLEASFLNPFIERFQLLMDWSFEVGLPQAWKLYDENRGILKVDENVESDILQLKDLFQVFHTLLIGYTLASLLFLAEICFHDCIVRLNLNFYASKLRNYINQLGQIKQNKPKVRKQRQAKKIRRTKQKADKPKVRRIVVAPIYVED